MYGEFVFFSKKSKIHSPFPHTFVCRHLPARVRNEKVLVIAQ